MSQKIYDYDGARGKHLDVYEDRVVIRPKSNFTSVLTGSVLSGEKTIYFSDCIGIQFKKAGLVIGYLQFETANAGGNDGLFSENTFNWETMKIPNKKMIEVAEYCKKQIEEYKTKKNTVVVNEVSAADEIKKFKELLDTGVITEEEFNAKKKELLGL